MSAWTPVRLTARPPERLFQRVFEPHDGRDLVPIPKEARARERLNTPVRGWPESACPKCMLRPIRGADVPPLPGL
jgi:hypothetical protein